MPEKISFALLGCGSIAQKYSTVITQQLQNARLAAVCDVSEERAQAFGEQHGVPWFTCGAEMMERMGDRIDVVNILTPSGYHCQNVLQLAPYGKHLCVEKPMALTLDDADAMIAACDRAQIHLFVVHQNRFNRPVQKLRAALEQGRLGKLVLGSVHLRWSRSQSYYDQANWRGTFALDGGVFANQAYHFIDLLQWLMGDVEAVMANGVTRRAAIEAEDTGVVLLQFRNGTLGTVEATTATSAASQECSLRILGAEGTVEIAGFSVNEMRLWKFDQTQPEDEEILIQGCQNPLDNKAFGHFCYLDSVVQTLTAGQPAAVDGREGRRSLEVIAAIYESIATGKSVQLGASSYRSRLGYQPNVMATSAAR